MQHVVTAGKKLWTPAELTSEIGGDYRAWWDGADSSTLTLVSGVVSQWRDKSGNGFHMDQPTAADRPALSTINGVQALDFDGSNDCMLRTANIATNVINMAFVVDPLNNGLDQNLTNGQGFDNNNFEFDWAGVDNVVYWNGTGPIQYVDGSPSAIAMFSCRTGGGAYIRKDGTQRASGNNGTGTWGTTAWIGCREGSSEYFSGDLGELICWQATDNGARDRIEGYLAWKWHTNTLLPASHPYKNAPPLLGYN